MNLLEIINTPTNEEFKRLYHGRGEKTYPFLTIDSINDTLLIQFYKEADEKPFLDIFAKAPRKYKNVIIKKRITQEVFALRGKIPNNAVAVENGILFKLNFYNQNIGYFGDMKNARAEIAKISKDKSVLNLFAYTGGFSLFAKKGGAKLIANVDMNKGALKTAQQNHVLNNLETKGVLFWQYNILKAFNRLKKKAPYDIIIIDPPSFQKGSFEANKDYPKLLKKIPSLSHNNTLLVCAINSPLISKNELKQTVEENCGFTFYKEIPPPKEYTNSTLKTLIFNPSQR
ncbi:MAG: methyltransferase domain-containing protein [Epsilonproteobacteria bacterium]|nr:methyltransferase domain-containing protein [Campylobacterota bacterium]